MVYLIVCVESKQHNSFGFVIVLKMIDIFHAVVCVCGEEQYGIQFGSAGALARKVPYFIWFHMGVKNSIMFMFGFASVLNKLGLFPTSSICGS